MNRLFQIPEQAYNELTLGPGVIASDFNPYTGVLNQPDILAYAEDVSFSAEPIVSEMRNAADNLPKNVLDLMRLDGWNAALKGRFISVNPPLMNIMLMGSSQSSGQVSKIAPGRSGAVSSKDLWFICDYSCVFGGAEGGFFAVKLKNTFSSGGIRLGSKDSGLMGFDFCFTVGQLLTDGNACFEVYIKNPNT